MRDIRKACLNVEMKQNTLFLKNFSLEKQCIPDDSKVNFGAAHGHSWDNILYCVQVFAEAQAREIEF